MRGLITISGYLVGPIWMPPVECYKHFTYDLSREAPRLEGRDGERATLRDHILSMMTEQGGDFQWCEIADAVLCITIYKPNRQRSRIWYLRSFPSIADCIKTDWAGPDPEHEEC